MKHTFLRTICLLAACIAALCLMAGSSLAEGNFDFEVPQGFFIPETEDTDTECIIACAEQRVGGIIRTELGADVMKNHDLDAVMDYLMAYVPEGLECEYMAGYGTREYDPIDVSLILVNLDSMSLREFKHWFFLKNDACYDLWLDSTYISGEDECKILKSTGVNPNVEYVGDEFLPKPNFDFTMPDGVTAGDVADNTLPIFQDGVQVAGVTATKIKAGGLYDADDTVFTEEMQDAMVYPLHSYTRFAVIHHLTQNLPWATNYEYMIMYAGQDTDTPVVSVSFAITDEDGKRTEIHHTFFQKDEVVYDLWEDRSILNPDIHFSFASVHS